MLNVTKMIASAEACLGWPYESPGTNDRHGIDCSGLFVKIYDDQGDSIYHGSNTIYRKYCTENRGKISSVSQLRPGYAVFKWNSNTPAKFNDGLGDFQHIGLVVSVKPLKIIHASSAVGHVTTDTAIGKWKYYGELKNVDYGGGTTMNEETKAVGTPAVVTTKVVFAESGTSVKMRAKPDAKCNIYWDIPIGTQVEVIQSGDVWSEIKVNKRSGYMMSKFLKDDMNADDSEDKEIVTVTRGDLENIYELLETALSQFIIDRSGLQKAYDITGDLLGLRG